MIVETQEEIDIVRCSPYPSRKASDYTNAMEPEGRAIGVSIYSGPTISKNMTSDPPSLEAGESRRLIVETQEGIYIVRCSPCPSRKVSEENRHGPLLPLPVSEGFRLRGRDGA